MASQISMDEVAKCVLDGLENAHKEYFEWSDGEYIWSAPEYLLTVNIAKELKKSKEVKYLTLEDNVEYILENANVECKGEIHKALRKDGRFDIVLWGSDKEPTPPIAIVEVKNKVYCFGRIEEDIERIKQTLLMMQSTIEFGLMAFYATNTYKGLDNNFNGLVEGLLKNTQECLNGKSGKEQFCIEKFERHIQDKDNIIDGNVYRPIVFKIQKK